jgi:CDP-glycerol glycerophosphotransferase (TagB/SpsB family)
LRDLADRYEVIGHGHPRIWPVLEPQYRRFGIEPVAEFDDVMARAAVYVCDNSSTIYEFASTDRPVVVLNAPWYRREVEHGLRFWSLIPGEQVAGPEELPRAIDRALAEDPYAERRREVVAEVYAYTDGKAAARAADAIRALSAGR